jgi:hypothetical protein
MKLIVAGTLPIPGSNFWAVDYDEIAFLMLVPTNPDTRKLYKNMYAAQTPDGQFEAVAHLGRAWQTSTERAQEVADELNGAPGGLFIQLRILKLVGHPVPCKVEVIRFAPIKGD